jgi:putative glycosyltransferase (TIGR04372 family)
MIHLIKKRFIIFPLGKIAMYSANLLPFIYFYEKHNCKLTVLIPSHKFFSNRNKYGVVNKSLLGIIKRSFDEKNIKYSENPLLISTFIFLEKIKVLKIRGKSEALNEREFYLKNKSLVSIMPQYSTCPSAFNRKKPFCKLSLSENNKGKDVLLSHGIDTEKRIVTFHVRDNMYHPEQDLDFRDSSVNELIATLDFLGKNDFNTYRMGSLQKSIDTEIFPRGVINYTEEFRDEFMDLYLIDKSDFFIGSTSGLWCIPYLFNTPQVNLNHIPFHDSTFGKNDIWLPKKLWLIEEKRFMKFSEILSVPRIKMLSGSFYNDNNIEVVDNTSDEIFDAVAEMLKKIDGNLVYDESDNYYWKKLKNMYRVDSPARYSSSRISKSFLYKYKELLD